MSVDLSDPVSVLGGIDKSPCHSIGVAAKLIDRTQNVIDFELFPSIRLNTVMDGVEGPGTKKKYLRAQLGAPQGDGASSASST